MKKWVNNTLYGFVGFIIGVGMSSVSEPTDSEAEVESTVMKPVAVKTVEAVQEAPDAETMIEEPVKVIETVAPKPIVAVKPVSKEGISKTEALKSCNELIKTATAKYAKVKIRYLTDTAFMLEDSGEAKASIGFTITKNDTLNNFVGYCYFNSDKSVKDFEIKED